MLYIAIVHLEQLYTIYNTGIICYEHFEIDTTVILFFLYILHFLASTMQSTDSATKEQARRLRKRLQQTRLATSPLADSTPVNTLDAATARARLRLVS